ncbi:MAG: pyroglutamyl-peptidase [Francisella sp.]|jgi:pyroglutamyl-peptidase
MISMRKFFIIVMTLFISVFVYSKTVLITGFTPFGDEKINPSFEAVKGLPNKIKGAKIIKKEIPVTFKGAAEKLDSLIKEYNPDVVISVGEAGGRSDISIERVAINVDDARIPDNDGYKPHESKISNQGDNAYFSTLPINKIVRSINTAGIPANISNTAGTYVCNHIMYHLLELFGNKYPDKIGGFIHVPYAPQQVVSKKDIPSMSIPNMTLALHKAIEVSLDTLR